MSLATDADYLDARADALHELRSARRRKRVQSVDWFDAFYKAYLGAILGTLAIYGAAGELGTQAVSTGALRDIRSDGPYYLGIVLAVAVAIGLRSGGRGGPLAFEIADVRHILMSPVDRRDSIRSVAMRGIRHALFLGAALGGTIGIVATRRLPENAAEWVAAGIVFGAVAGGVSYAAALVFSGRRMRSWIADLVGIIFILWSVAAMAIHIQISPFGWIGTIATAPLHLSPWSIGGLVVACAVLWLAFVSAEGLSLETAERRSSLVGTLRFAATTQDVRTVMLIQRQLSQQTMRTKPWVRLRPPRRPKSHPTTGAFVRRSVQSLLRWPLIRFVRLIALVAIAQVCVFGIWAGTGPLVVVAGIALWLAAIDLLEPLAQETDRPDIGRSMPVLRGSINFRHLVVPTAVMLVLVCGGLVPAVMLMPRQLISALLPLAVTAVLGAIGGAAIAVSRQPKFGSGSASVLTPEVAGVQLLWRIAAPPAFGVLALVPLALARSKWFETHQVLDVSKAINLPASGALALATWGILWTRYEDQLREYFSPAKQQELAKEKKAERDEKVQNKKAASKPARNKKSGAKKK